MKKNIGNKITSKIQTGARSMLVLLITAAMLLEPPIMHVYAAGTETIGASTVSDGTVSDTTPPHVPDDSVIDNETEYPASETDEDAADTGDAETVDTPDASENTEDSSTETPSEDSLPEENASPDDPSEEDADIDAPDDESAAPELSYDENEQDASYDIASGTCYNVSWNIDAAGNLTIEGSGEITDKYYSHPHPWLAYKDDILTAQVKLTGTKNLQCILAGCKNLTSVDFTGSNLQNIEHMGWMFSNCESLTNITWGNMDTSRVTNMYSMFICCESLVSLDLSSFDTTSVTEFEGMFAGCKKLSDLRLGKNFVCDNATRMGTMFSHCESLTSLDLSGFNTRKATSLYQIFYGCKSLETLILSDDFSTENVTDLSSMFHECESLKSVNLRGFNTSKVTDFHHMFYGCKALTDIDLSSFDVSQVEYKTDEGSIGAEGIDNMFTRCTSLTELDLSSFDLKHIKPKSANGRLIYFASELPNLVRIYTPRNIDSKLSIHFTSYSSGSSWYTAANYGEDTFAQSLDYIMPSGHKESILLVRNDSIPDGIVSKQKTVYACGESINLDDISILDNHYGTYQYITEFTTNKETININTAGKKTLAVTYTALSSGKEVTKNIELTFTDSLSDVKKLTLTLEQDSYSYNAKYQKPVPTVKYEGALLTEGTDYTVSYSNNRNAGTARVIVTGKGIYSGTAEKAFTITKAPVTFRCHTVYLTPDDKLDGWDSWFTWEGLFKGDKIDPSPYSMLNNGLDIPRDENGKLKVGVYNILASNKNITNTNYNITYVDGELHVVSKGITAVKTITSYKCGETISLSDLTVTYIGNEGSRILASGEYRTNVDALNADKNTPGKKELTINYTDPEGMELTAKIDIFVTLEINGSNISVTVDPAECVYAAAEITPTPTVKITASNTTLTKDTDYTVSYSNNINVGKASLTVTGKGIYSGSASITFTITPRPVKIRAKEITISAYAGSDLVAVIGSDWYEIENLPQNVTIDDVITVAPTYVINDGYTPGKDSDGDYRDGRYKIVPDAASVNANYTIDSYINGWLTIPSPAYMVGFDPMGHGGCDSMTAFCKPGSLIKGSFNLTDDDYLLMGWYTDRSFKTAWDFSKDTVNRTFTLYACWVKKTSDTGVQFCVQDIPKQTYTGSPIKPAVVVYDKDGATLLKANKDYTIKYFNNTNVSAEGETGGIGSSINDTANGFDKTLPYVEIAGKGNYSGSIFINFVIAPYNLSDGYYVRSEVTLKCTTEFVKDAKKELKPFSSIKYKKNLALEKDFTITLTPDGGAYDKVNSENSTIKPGATGVFYMTIDGCGNYTGTVSQKIVVKEDKNQLLSKAAIALGSNIKNVVYTGDEIRLPSGYYDPASKKYYDTSGVLLPDAKNIFTVKAGSRYLKENVDYTVSYQNNKAVGTATMTITGKGEYAGTKSVTFKIGGIAFNAKNISVQLENEMNYSGLPLTQNRAELTVAKDITLGGKNINGSALIYGRDYKISYKNNINTGKATMTFTALPESGWTGSFSKNFSIKARDFDNGLFIDLQDWKKIDDNVELGEYQFKLAENIPYSRAGAVPTDQLVLINRISGRELAEGKDYTVKCTNNKKTAAYNSSTPPTMVYTFKGNIKGSFTVYFNIVPAKIDPQVNPAITYSATPVLFNKTLSDDAVVQAKITIKDGKQSLSAKDYEISYPKAGVVKAYFDKLENGTPTTDTDIPQATVRAVSGGSYTGSFQIPLPVYQTKLAAANLYVDYVNTADLIYTGSQLTPAVKVYYSADSSAVKAAKEKGDLSGLTLLSSATDYTLSYGSNDVAGKNKGSITVTGQGLYGGSVTVKFNIGSKAIYN